MSITNKITIGEPYSSTLTEEEFNKWMDDFWNKPPLAGSKMKLIILSAAQMQRRRWIAVNYMWKYKKGKTGRVYKRPSPYQRTFREWLSMRPVTPEELQKQEFGAVIIDEPIKE